MNKFARVSIIKRLFYHLVQPRAYFILLIIFLPTQLGYHFWPEYTRVFGLRIDYLAPTIYLTDLMMGALIISNLIKLIPRAVGIAIGYARPILPSKRGGKLPSFTRRGRGWFSFKNIKTTTALLLLAFLTLAALNILNSLHWQISLYQWLRVGQLILLGWYVYHHKKDPVAFYVLFNHVPVHDKIVDKSHIPPYPLFVEVL